MLQGGADGRELVLQHVAGHSCVMDIDTTAPGITRDEILIDAPLDAVWRIQTNISAWLT